MGIKLKNIDEDSALRTFSVNFSWTASSGEVFAHIPYACHYDKAVFAAGAASAGLAFGISNIATTDAIVSAGFVQVSASDATIAAGEIFTISATGQFEISQNTLLRVDHTSTTADGALRLYFKLNENKEI